MNHLLRGLFFLCVVRPVVLVALGINVRRREQLPSKGPAIVVANHNSHLDTMVLMTLFPLRLLPKLRPVAAADYFFANRWLKWFALRIIGILPLERRPIGGRRDPLGGLGEALERGEILLLYPEGSRGEPEVIGEFKAGTAHLAKRFPHVPVYPLFLQGLGKALPKGEMLLVPFFCDVFVGAPLYWQGSKPEFMQALMDCMTSLAKEGRSQAWE